MVPIKWQWCAKCQIVACYLKSSSLKTNIYATTIKKHVFPHGVTCRIKVSNLVCKTFKFMIRLYYCFSRFFFSNFSSLAVWKALNVWLLVNIFGINKIGITTKPNHSKGLLVLKALLFVHCYVLDRNLCAQFVCHRRCQTNPHFCLCNRRLLVQRNPKRKEQHPIEF